MFRFYLKLENKGEEGINWVNLFTAPSSQVQLLKALRQNRNES